MLGSAVPSVPGLGLIWEEGGREGGGGGGTHTHTHTRCVLAREGFEGDLCWCTGGFSLVHLR